MRQTAAHDADHHRLDDGQREQRADRRVDRIAAGGEDLDPGSGGERVVRDHHAAGADGRCLLGGKGRGGAGAPVAMRHVHFLFRVNPASIPQ
jgi:hypothetical protein